MITKKIFVILFWFKICNGLQEGDDLHSSVTALNYVFHVEKMLINNLANYITRSEENINLMKNYLTDLKIENFYSLQSELIGGIVKDPLGSFLFKKRFLEFQALLNKTKLETIKNITTVQTEFDIPNDNDLEGVTLGILRVQEVYEIPAEQIADGMMNDINFGSKFNAADCFEVAFKLQELGYHYYAIQWYKIALKRIEEEGWKGIIPEFKKNKLLDWLAYSQFSEGSIESAKDSIESALKILNGDYGDRITVHVSENLKGYLDHYISLKEGIKESTAVYPPMGTLSRYNLTEMDLLKRGCRGELKKSSAEQRKLFCRYEMKNHPFLFLAPIKVEILNLEPYLVVFHDVMYDSEIETLKELSKEKLIRAGVWNEAKGVGEPSKIRTSKFVWFNNDTHPVMHTLNQRVSDMTGLTMETAEEFQLMNYGIGGHYDIHADYLLEPTEENGAKPFNNFEWGNRIATVLFYMADVLHGGGTTWPNINVLASPKKGAAAFWYNLFADGEPNYLSRHSACPIIAGSKWVVNKWIRSRGQEFRRPCLNYPDHLGKPKKLTVKE